VPSFALAFSIPARWAALVAYVTGYGMKGLKRSSFSTNDILIFPRTVSELPTNGPVRAAGEKPMYDFQRA
jgi:hypothetical protein